MASAEQEPMPDDAAPPDPSALDDKKKKKKADKARGAWISFAGRIIAQIVGAVASVVLGMLVLQRYQQTSAPEPAANAAAAATPARATARRPGPATIAVLPLANLSGNAAQEYFVDGMTEALTAGLAQVEGLRVISRTSAMRYKTEHPAIPEIARALGADLLVEGAVLQAGNQVRITAQLIDGGTDEHLWAESYTRQLDDVIALQDAVATAIATAIKGTVSRRPGSRPVTQHAVDPVAYDLYLRGRHAWNLRTPDSLTAAIGFFTQAVERDPGFALAHVGLADAYALQGSPSAGPIDSRAGGDRAKAAAIRALDLDGSLAEAHTALGGVLFFAERDLRDAELKFRRAIELNPSYPVAHEWLAILLAELGRDAEALEHVEIAVALNPLEATMHQARGMVHYYARRFDDAARSERRALELRPGLPLARALLVKALTLNGLAAAAVSACEAPGAAPEDVDVTLACAVAATRANRAAQAAALPARLEARRPAPGPALAQLEAALGDYPAAFIRLNRLAERGNLPPALLFDPLFEPLRQTPEWPAIAARLAAPPATR